VYAKRLVSWGGEVEPSGGDGWPGGILAESEQLGATEAGADVAFDDEIIAQHREQDATHAT